MPGLSEVRGKDLIVVSLRDKYLSNSEIDPDQCKQSMGAGDAVAKCLFKWLVAVEAYDKVAKQVAPICSFFLSVFAFTMIRSVVALSGPISLTPPSMIIS